MHTHAAPCGLSGALPVKFPTDPDFCVGKLEPLLVLILLVLQQFGVLCVLVARCGLCNNPPVRAPAVVGQVRARPLGDKGIERGGGAVAKGCQGGDGSLPLLSRQLAQVFGPAIVIREAEK